MRVSIKSWNISLFPTEISIIVFRMSEVFDSRRAKGRSFCFYLQRPAHRAQIQRRHFARPWYYWPELTDMVSLAGPIMEAVAASVMTSVARTAPAASARGVAIASRSYSPVTVEIHCSETDRTHCPPARSSPLQSPCRFCCMPYRPRSNDYSPILTGWSDLRRCFFIWIILHKLNYYRCIKIQLQMWY